MECVKKKKKKLDLIFIPNGNGTKFFFIEYCCMDKNENIQCEVKIKIF